MEVVVGKIINKNHIEAQQGVNMFPFLFCSQIMQLDIFREFQQDKNIRMILFFGVPHPSYRFFFIFTI